MMQQDVSKAREVLLQLIAQKKQLAVKK